jgi:hypothetical protein
MFYEIFSKLYKNIERNKKTRRKWTYFSIQNYKLNSSKKLLVSFCNLPFTSQILLEIVMDFACRLFLVFLFLAFQKWTVSLCLQYRLPSCLPKCIQNYQRIMERNEDFILLQKFRYTILKRIVGFRGLEKYTISHPWSLSTKLVQNSIQISSNYERSWNKTYCGSRWNRYISLVWFNYRRSKIYDHKY